MPQLSPIWYQHASGYSHKGNTPTSLFGHFSTSHVPRLSFIGNDLFLEVPKKETFLHTTLDTATSHVPSFSLTGNPYTATTIIIFQRFQECTMIIPEINLSLLLFEFKLS